MQNFIKNLLLLFFTTIFIASYTNIQAQNTLADLNTYGNFQGPIGTGYNVTNYTIINPVNGTSTPGKYGLTTNPNLMNSTYISGGDHTTGSGKMMVIDGSTSGFQFFWTTGSCGCPISGFTVGETYTFSFWVKSVSNDVTSLTQSVIQPLVPVGVAASDQNPPNIIVPLPALGWQQVGFTFTATSGSIMIRLTTQSTSAVGNDFAVDDFSIIKGTLPLVFNNDVPTPTDPTCPNSSDGSITASANFGKKPYSYTITGPKTITNTSGVFNGLPVGTYNISVTDSNSPSTTITQPTPITLSGPPNDLVVSPDTSTCPGKPTILTASGGKGGYTWTANPTDSSLTTPNDAIITVSPNQTTTYTVTSGLTSNPTNFIANGDFSFGNSDFTTDYTFTSNPAGNGQQRCYGIVTNPKTWFNAFSSCPDHTTGTGRMFVADGATNVAKVWTQNVSGLLPNQDYDFSYYIQSVTSGTVAKMEVLINGVSLGALKNAPASNCQWMLHKYTWNSGSNTSATITIYNRDTSAGGNDFAIDDIAFTESVYCTFQKTTTITIDSSVDLTITAPAAVCSPVTVDITDPSITAGSTPGTLSYWIDDQATNPLTNPNAISVGATYYIKNTVSSCFIIKPVTVTITNSGSIVAPTVSTPVNYCQNDTPVALSATPLSGATLNWYGTNATGGVASTTAPTPSTSTVGPPISYYVSQTTGTCESPRAKIDVIVSPIPTITSVKPKDRCGVGTVSLEAVASSGSAVINWYDTPTGGISLGTESPFTTPSITTDTTYYVDASENGCTTPTRTAILASIKPIPVLTITCGTSSVTSVTFNWNLIADATSYDYSYSVASGTPVLGSVSGATSTLTVNGLSAGQKVDITITPVGSACGAATNANCSSLNCSSPTLTVSAPPVCSGTIATVTATPITLGTYSYAWTVPTGATNPGNVASFTTTATGNYSVIITDTTTSCPSASEPVTVTINPLPTVTVSAPPICSGASATVTATPGTTGNYNYVWTVPSGATNPGNLASFQTTVVGNYNVIITDIVTTCSSASASETVTINILPTVSVNSPSVCSGVSATITATPGITGTYSYTWTVPLGATNPGNVADFSTAVAGSYDVIITNTTTTCSSASASGTLTLSTLPTVSVNSPSVCSGASATVTATPGTIGTYNYAWTLPLGSSNPGNVASFSTTVVGTYSVVITDPVTTCSSASTSGTVSINTVPIVTVNNPSICTGTNATIIATPGTTETFNYTWTVPSGVSNPGNVSSFPTAIAGSYSVIITNPLTTCSSASASGTATINALPTVSVNSPTTCSGMNATVTATPGNTGTYSYSWSVPSGATNPGNVASFSTAVAGNFSVIITNTTTTCPSTSASGTVTINTLPTVSVSSPPVCSGVSATVTAIPGTTGSYTYSWTVPSGATNPGNVASFSTTVIGNYSLIMTDNVSSCASASTSVNVTENAIPDVLNPPSPQTICSGENAGVALLSSVAGTTFSWTVTSTGVTGASAGNGVIISQVLTASGTSSGTVDYTVTPTANGCVGTPVVISFIVSPTPIVSAIVSSSSICSSTATNIKLSSTIASTTYDWNVIQSNSTGALQGSGDTIIQTLSTNGNKSGEAVYAITPSINGCSGLTIKVAITVNPIPQITANPDKETICSGGETNISLASNVGTTTFDWTVNQTGVTGALSGSGSTIEQTLTTRELKEGLAEYTITPKVNGCLGTQKSVIVKVNPTPEIFGTPGSRICSGESPNIKLSPSISGTEFNWIAAPTAGISGATSSSGDLIDDILKSGNAGGSVSYTITPTYRGCVGESITVVINVDPLPDPTIKDGKICIEKATGKTLNPYLLETNISNTNFDFTWFFNDVKINGATENRYEATKTGVYSVIVFNKLTGCSSKKTIATVTETFPAVSFTPFVTDAFTENATITVTVDGDANEYLYKIDNGAWQNSNVFTGLGGGTYTISVTDVEGCTDLSQTATIIDYPKFFTPNGDGFNDTWNIIGLRDQPKSTILIYDRYGKLLKQISTKGDGWDGTFNSQVLPSTDYWFTINYLENNIEKLFKAHFSLKR